MRRPAKAYILVDWDNVRKRYLPKTDGLTHDRIFDKTITALQEEIIRCHRVLCREPTAYYMRIYHGWYIKREQVQERRAFEREIYLNRNKYERTTRVAAFFAPTIGEKPILDGKYGTIFDTHRGKEGQKMVDTLICVDAISILLNGIAGNVIIASDDDDFVPLLFSIEQMNKSAYIIRYNSNTTKNISDVECDRILYWRERR